MVSPPESALFSGAGDPVKHILIPLALGLLCGLVVFGVINVLNIIVPTAGNLQVSLVAAVFAGAIEGAHVYSQRKK